MVIIIYSFQKKLPRDTLLVEPKLELRVLLFLMNLLFPPSPILLLHVLFRLVFLLRLVSMDLLMDLEMTRSALPKVRESVTKPAISNRLGSGGRHWGCCSLVKVRVILAVVFMFGVMVGLVFVNLLVRGLAVHSPVLFLLVLVIFMVMLGFVLVNLLEILEVPSATVFAMALPTAMAMVMIITLVCIAGYDSPHNKPSETAHWLGGPKPELQW
jgi:hypothetical protein